MKEIKILLGYKKGKVKLWSEMLQRKDELELDALTQASLIASICDFKDDIKTLERTQRLINNNKQRIELAS